MTAAISVLVVDNEPGFADLVASMLEREREEIVAAAATSADEALETVETVDCIVSDYEMPETSGLELLERVREVDPDLPFILFTGRGSEEIASEAIAAGVTQYVRKEPGRERYAMLANQITNAVSQYRTETELRESEDRYERTLTALHETTRDLMRAGTKDEIYRLAVETAADLLDVSIVRAYAFDPSASRLEVSAATGDVQDVGPVERPAQGGESLVWEAFSAGESAYYEDVREHVESGTLARSELLVPLGSHGVLVAGAEAVDGFDDTMRELCHVLAANTEAALDRAERETLLREHDRRLTRQNEELTRLNHINEIVRAINLGIAKASTREEIETTVCDRLAGTDRYRFAWIASGDDEPPAPAAWAGVDPAYVDRVHEDGDEAPEVTAIRETFSKGTDVVVRDVLEAEGWEPRRKEALTHGFQTVLVVPIADDDRHYGALFVHAAGVDSIDENEREVLGELGETVGYAIRSVERTRAMLTDGRIEIELECADSRLLLNRLSERVAGPVSIEGVIERGDGAIVLFVHSEADADELAALEAEWATIEGLSVLSEDEDDALFELTISATPFLELLRSYDVRLSGVTACDGVADLLLAVPRRVETRSLIESIRAEYPETELRARREERSRSSPGSVRSQLETRLTDRQFEALKAAYFSGFFEWPRDSTGEDLAAVLEVSPPTYHYHLRAAQRKLVTLVFDGATN